MNSIIIDPTKSAGERRRRLYEGDIIVHSALPSVMALVDYARERITDALSPHDPLDVHEHLSPDALAAVLVAFKPSFIHDKRASALQRAIVDELGFDLGDTYLDLPKLRTSYPQGHLTTGIAYAFQQHRDTWYAAPRHQINWWLPLWDVDETNAMEFLPAGFGAHVPNNSGRYNYYEANRWRAQIATFSSGNDTRVHPAPDEPFGADAQHLVVLPPVGGVMLFAGDHLHASLPNTSGRARYSIDFRTVHGPDSDGVTGAPAIDVACSGTALRDFKRGTTGETLPPDVIALYDNVADVTGLDVEFVPTVGA